MTVPNPQRRVPGLTSFQYDERALRYRHRSNGQFVSESIIQDATLQVLDGQRALVERLAVQLQTGQISLSAWETEMLKVVRVVHTMAGALAVGGFGRFDDDVTAKIEAEIARQHRYLHGFAIDLHTGAQPLNDTLLVRAGMYVDAANGTIQELRRDQADQAGYDQERRVLGPADHCRDCLDAARRSWKPIGTLPRIGESVCRTNCHCTFQFRRKP